MCNVECGEIESDCVNEDQKPEVDRLDWQKEMTREQLLATGLMGRSRAELAKSCRQS